MSTEYNISNGNNVSGDSQITVLSRDIAHAVFRVARLVRNRKLRMELENASIDLVRDIDIETANSLERLVKLAKIIGEMNKTNMEVLCRELAIFRKLVFGKTAKIAKLPNSGKIVDIESMFNEKGSKQPEKIAKTSSDRRKKRQTEILQLIRKFPDGRQAKELSERFPHISQRTLRNDIQMLLDGEKIERIGTRVIIKRQPAITTNPDTVVGRNRDVKTGNGQNIRKIGGKTANDELSELSVSILSQTGIESSKKAFVSGPI